MFSFDLAFGKATEVTIMPTQSAFANMLLFVSQSITQTAGDLTPGKGSLLFPNYPLGR